MLLPPSKTDKLMIGHRDDLIAKNIVPRIKSELRTKVAQIGFGSTSCNIHPLAGVGGNEPNVCVFAAQICTQMQLSLNTWSYQMLKQSLMVLTGSFAFEETTWKLQWTHPFNYSKRGCGFLSNVMHEKLSSRNSGLQHTLWYPFMGPGFLLRKCTERVVLRVGFVH